MERIIKFRGRRLDNGEWVYGSLFCLNDERHIMKVVATYQVDPKTVGQYIGRADKDGDDLYEGMTIAPTTWTTKNSIIIFRDGCFMFKEIDEEFHAPYSFSGSFGGWHQIKIVHDKTGENDV